MFSCVQHDISITQKLPCHNQAGNGTMHPVQEHVNTLGIDCKIPYFMKIKGTVSIPECYN